MCDSAKPLLKSRIATLSDFMTVNPVLGVNEIAYIQIAGRFKVGDGKKTFAELPWSIEIAPGLFQATEKEKF
jgi:hypothetical protein